MEKRDQVVSGVILRIKHHDESDWNLEQCLEQCVEHSGLVVSQIMLLDPSLPTSRRWTVTIRQLIFAFTDQEFAFVTFGAADLLVLSEVSAEGTPEEILATFPRCDRQILKS